MVSIVRATDKDFKLLADLGKKTFFESHGLSAEQKDLDTYSNTRYSYDFLKKDLKDSNNIYHIIFFENRPVGYSKIIPNYPNLIIESKNVTKLEKIFLLKEYYDQKLGAQLFNYNVSISKALHQSGMWLYVWIENPRAINFYIKNGFKIIGNYDFKVSETHTNPNYQMFLKYSDQAEAH